MLDAVISPEGIDLNDRSMEEIKILCGWEPKVVADVVLPYPVEESVLHWSAEISDDWDGDLYKFILMDFAPCVVAMPTQRARVDAIVLCDLSYKQKRKSETAYRAIFKDDAGVIGSEKIIASFRFFDRRVRYEREEDPTLIGWGRVRPEGDSFWDGDLS